MQLPIMHLIELGAAGLHESCLQPFKICLHQAECDTSHTSYTTLPPSGRPEVWHCMERSLVQEVLL